MPERRYKYVQLFALLLFAAALFAVPVQQWQAPETNSRENRSLAAMPGWPQSEKDWLALPQSFSDYMDDHFGFRGKLLRWHNRLSLMLGVSPSEKVVLGKNGWLFYDNQRLTDQNRGAMPLKEHQLRVYLEGFRRQREWVEAQGVVYVLLPVPDKNTIYPDYLPDRVKRLGPSRFEQVLGYLSALGEPYAETAAPLHQARLDGLRLYFQTDTHWSCGGAFVAYEALMDRLESLALPGVKRLRRDDIQFSDDPPQAGGDMARNMLLLDDVVLEHESVSCYPGDPSMIEAVRLDDGYVSKRPYLPNNQAQHWRFTRKEQPPRTRVLLYRDSYAHALIPYLINTFDEVIVVPRVQMTFDKDFFVEYKPDLVIYEFVERSLIWVPRGGEDR